STELVGLISVAHQAIVSVATVIHSRQHPHIPPTPCAKMPSRRLSASCSLCRMRHERLIWPT
ncbi:hypothetical protein Q0S58_05810, partial [Escherichia coli :H7]